MRLKIKELREMELMTQKELAARISSVQRNVSNWEKGTSEPDLEMVVRIADCFEVTLDELFGRCGGWKSGDASHVLLLNRPLTERQRRAVLELIDSFGQE